ncbi:MAG: serine/threonine protein kinase [Theionarchaea archaeon]|nr:MAG: hypothetical protein AYK19_11115 [Theionarchaea archaeon DG-70-1]MBU7028350.1 serine/threonine protein kinase [Theionarchaea archaeon]
MTFKENPPDNTSVAVVRNPYCYSCSQEVAAHAYADGRAEELADIVLYLCGTCAAQQQKKVDINHIGEYRILEILGRGGMSVVYKAWHEPTCRVVALKRIVPEVAAYKRAQEVFQHEIDVMQDLIHPCIIHLIDHKIAEHQFYFVYEYMSKGDLHSYAHRSNVSTTDICRIFCQILEGLDYVHKKGYVHRDVKLKNMLITEGGKGKLSDFTLAQKLHEPGMAGSDVKRAIFFLAPEEIRDPKYVNPSADVYAVGVSMYYILSGRSPFHVSKSKKTIENFLKGKKFETPSEMVSKYGKELESAFFDPIRESILEDDRIPIQHYRKDLPSELACIVDKSVMRNERERFKSAQELRDALMTYLTS